MSRHDRDSCVARLEAAKQDLCEWYKRTADFRIREIGARAIRRRMVEIVRPLVGEKYSS
jgi:hypothetical protein